MSFNKDDDDRELWQSMNDQLEMLEGDLKQARRSFLLPEVKMKLESMKKRIEYILENYP